MVLIIITKMANAMMQMDEGIAPQKESPASAKGGLGGGAPHIFRYKLSDDLMALISQFAKIHQYDDRHSYKDAWEHQWLND